MRARAPRRSRPFDLAEIASEIAKAFEQERREHDVQVEVKAEPGVGIEGAPGQIRQVLWNLLRNAAEAMPRGGIIQLEVTREDTSGRPPWTLLSVRDTGVGIAPEDIRHIFEPFFSTQAGGHGPGPGHRGPHRRGSPGPHRNRQPSRRRHRIRLAISLRACTRSADRRARHAWLSTAGIPIDLGTLKGSRTPRVGLRAAKPRFAHANRDRVGAACVDLPRPWF